MADPSPATFDIRCPGCQATLTVDPEARAVLAHAAPPRRGPAPNLDRALETLKDAESRRDARFREAADAEKGKTDLLSRKFAEGIRRAKDSPDPPPRPLG